MQSDAVTPPVSKLALWTGRVITAVPVAMLVMSGIMKLVKPADLVKGFADLGYLDSLARPLGVVELVCTILYVIPQTAVLGAILLTGYLGGATATHLRVNDPFIAPIILGVLVWLGLYLRDARLRALAPLRKLV